MKSKSWFYMCIFDLNRKMNNLFLQNFFSFFFTNLWDTIGIPNKNYIFRISSSISSKKSKFLKILLRDNVLVLVLEQCTYRESSYFKFKNWTYLRNITYLRNQFLHFFHMGRTKRSKKRTFHLKFCSIQINYANELKFWQFLTVLYEKK